MSIIEPVKVQAIAVPIAGSFATYEALQAFVAMIILLKNMGVSYPDFETAKSNVIYLNNILDAEYEQIFDGGPPGGDNDPNTILGYIGGTIMGLQFPQFLLDKYGSIKSALTDIWGHLFPGNNIISEKSYTIGNYSIGIGVTNYRLYATVNGQTYFSNRQGTSEENPRNLELNSVYIENNNLYVKIFYDRTLYDGSTRNYMDIILVDDEAVKLAFLDYGLNTEQNNIMMDIDLNSPLLETDPLLEWPTSTSLFLPALPIIDPDNEKVEFAVLPSGQTQQIYNGSMEEYQEDLLNNITWDQLQGLETNPQTHIQELINANGESYLVLQPVVGDVPYPDINQDPITDAAQFQGLNIGLLQGMTNWLRMIWESIISIPQWLLNLFVLPEGYFQTKLDLMETNLSSRVNNDSVIAFFNNLKNISAKPIPDLEYQGSIILKSDYANNIASTLKSWIRFVMWVYMALFGMNKAYMLIRGGNAIDGSWYKDDSTKPS